MKIALGNVAEGREADAGRGRTNEGIRGTRAYWYVVGCAADLQAAFRHSMRNVGMSSRKKRTGWFSTVIGFGLLSFV